MERIRKLYILVLLLSVVSVRAQELNFWQKVNRLLTTVNNIDTTYIYQPKQGFTLGAFTTIQKAGFDMTAKYTIYGKDGEAMHGVSIYTVKEQLSTKPGIELGYGKLIVGFGLEVGPRKAYKKRALGLNVLGKAWGLHLNYYKITNPFKSSLTIGEEGDEDYFHEEIMATESATLRSFSVDGYYVFNHKKFAYPAVYKAGLVQRRTTGSWMLTASFMRGSLHNSPRAALSSFNLLDCFTTMQISLGGGYSANFVCWHKEPVALRDKGLRNATINLTVLPVLTAFNYLKVLAYDYDEAGNCTGQTTTKAFGYPMPNFIGSAAFGMTLDRFFISTQFVYNWFYFLSSTVLLPKELLAPNYVDEFSFRGSFHDWKVKVLFTYKF